MLIFSAKIKPNIEKTKIFQEYFKNSNKPSVKLRVPCVSVLKKKRIIE